jgi:hypothetical protein
MIMTIKKAETLVCPYNGNIVNTLCITDNCMAWQEVENSFGRNFEQVLKTDTEKLKAIRNVEGIIELKDNPDWDFYQFDIKEKLPRNECTGYCGRLVNE